MISIRAHFDGKVFVPEEPVVLPVDQTVTLHIEAQAPKPNGESSVLDWLDNHAIEATELPVDLASEVDHYLYGTPKRGG